MPFFAERPRILIPVVDHADLVRLADVAAAWGAARMAELTAIHVIEVTPDKELSSGATAARAARVRLDELTAALPHPVHPLIRIDRSVAEGVVAAATELRPDLLLAGWTDDGPIDSRPREIVEAIVRACQDAAVCHVAMVRLGRARTIDRVLVAVRGGPHAELALALAGAIAAGRGLPVTVIHVMPPGLTGDARRASEQSLLALAREHVGGEVQRVVHEAPDVVAAICDETGPGDLLFLGASVPGMDAIQPPHSGPVQVGTEADPLGAVPGRLVREARGSVIVVRTGHEVPAGTFDTLAASPGTLAAVDRAAEELRAMPRRVDRWFAESNYHHAEFADLRHLVARKEAQGLTVSLVLPTLNEEATIGAIVQRARKDLSERIPLVDELLVIDSASEDRTREIAESEGARVVQHPDVLAQYGSMRGKGEALWKSLYETTGDLIAWADTDVQDWHPRMVYGTLGPLIVEPRIQYVKGYYQRPIVEGGVLKEGGGGRVTELVARPLINLLYPELSGFIQPLSGEYAGRRTLLESIPFFSGYAVEIGHLIDIYERVGLDGLGQVDLERRVHRNQEIEGLSKMSFVILQAVLTRLESGRRAHLFAELGSRMKLPRSGPQELELEVIELGDHQRPPMIQISEYAGRRQA
jgi:hypothetical protein